MVEGAQFMKIGTVLSVTKNIYCLNCWIEHFTLSVATKSYKILVPGSIVPWGQSQADQAMIW